MTKNELIALFKQNKLGGMTDRTSALKFDDRVIGKYIDIVRKGVLGQLMQAHGVTDDFIKTFYPYLLWDKKRCIAYITLPASLIQLPDNYGLLHVSGIKDVESWQIIDNLSWQVYKNLESGATDPNQVCYLEGNTVICPKINETEVNRCVKVKILPDSNGYTRDEEFPIPVDIASFLELLYNAMQEQKATPDKTANDGNPNTP